MGANGRTGSRPVAQSQHPLLVEGRRDSRATIACQYLVSVYGRREIILLSGVPQDDAQNLEKVAPKSLSMSTAFLKGKD